MATLGERVTALEVHADNQTGQLADIRTKVSELHEHFLLKKGVAAERSRRRGLINTLVVLSASALSGFAAAITAVRAMGHTMPIPPIPH